MNIRATFCVIGFVLGIIVPARAETPGQRPYEMVWAHRNDDRRVPLIDFEELQGWSVITQDAAAEFSGSRAQQIWGAEVGKLVYRATGAQPKVTFTPPQPIVIPGSFDCVNLWVYGNNWSWAPDRSTPPVTIRVILRSATGTTVPVTLGSVRWKEWWLMHRRLSTEQITQLGEHPQVVGIEVLNGRNKEDRVLYFDNLAIYTEPLPPLKFEPRAKRNVTLPEGQTVGNNTGPDTLPFPTRPETLLPDNLADKFKVSLEQAEGTYRFRYEGDDGTLIYRYRPSSGTLSDIEAEWEGSGQVLRPLDHGGVVLALSAQSDAVPALELLGCRRHGNTLLATWRCTVGDVSTTVEYQFRLWQKSLVVDVACSDAVVEEFRVGSVVGADEPRVVTVPYLTGAAQRPGVLVAGPATDPLFVSVLLDHCRSNASLFWFDNRVSNEEACINGGSRYLPKTDGKRNRCFERLFLTVTPRFEETLPNIPNPKSPWMHVTGQRVWRAHGASDRQKDYEHWKKVARYGMTKVLITDHETGWRDGGESFTMRTRAAPGKGGDAGQLEYARKLHALGFRYGIYNNYTDYAPVNANWDEDYVTRTPDNQWQNAWARCYNPKPARAVELEARIAPIIQEKFHLNTAYCDVHTAVRPWSYCDFDARVPGAGTFAATFYAYGEIMLHQKATWNGPVYSEGNNHWYYCGLTDGNYGQDQLAQLATRPWLVDFDLLKMHPLCCNFGMGNPGMFFGGKRHLGATETQRQERLDRFLAATLAFGHTGFLVFEGGFDNAVQSYYCLQQVHANYASQSVKSIRYADAQGDLLDTSHAVANGAYRRSQIVTRYANGLEVYVNGNTSASWRTPQALLPPNGWYVHDTRQGAITALSAVVEGHRADYVDSPAYIYANGRGLLTRFPKAVCDGQLIAKRQDDGSTELIPLSNCHVMGIALDGQAATAVALDQSREPIGPATTRFSRGLVYVLPVANAVSYLLTPVAPPAAQVTCARVHVVPGETVHLQGARTSSRRIDVNAQVGSQFWHQVDDAWIDFSIVPLVDPELRGAADMFQLSLTPRSEIARAVTVSLGSETRKLELPADKTVVLTFPRAIPREESVHVLPLTVSAGALRFTQTWWVKTENARKIVADVSDFSGAGQRLRGQSEQPLNAKTRAAVYWQERACGDDLRKCLFIHPPYGDETGYTFARLKPIQLPKDMPVAFRCEVGKADGSDPGDGILFKVAVRDAAGKETIAGQLSVKRHVWRPFAVDLSAWQGQNVTIKLLTDVGPADNSSGDWGCWSNLRFESLRRELVTTVNDREVELSRAAGPLSNSPLTLEHIRSARSGRLHFQGIGLQNGAPYVSLVRLNNEALGELPAAGGNEQQGTWSDAAVTLSSQAIAALGQWNRVVVDNPGRDSFKVRRFWIELVLEDGEHVSSQITRTVFSQPATWLRAEGTGIAFGENIELDVRLLLEETP